MTPAAIRAKGFALTEPPGVDLPIQAVIAVTSPSGGDSIYEVRQYYSDEGVGERTTLQDVIESGGYMFTQRLSGGQDADLVIREVGSSAMRVAIGSLSGALIWGDPIREGARRAFSVYWSDGTYDMSLISGLETPASAVDIVRSIYCSP